MGVLAKLRNGLSKAAGKAADAVATAAQMSPKQVQHIDTLRHQFLTEKPESDGKLAQELTQRQLGAIGIEVYNVYLPQLSKLYRPIQETERFDGDNRISYFQICKWVKDPSEDNIEKLMNVYQVLNREECNIALIYHRSMQESSIYLAVVNNGAQSDPSEVETYKKRILGALKGNFPGAQLVTESSVKGFGVNVPDCIQCHADSPLSVASVSNLATEKTKKFSGQTIEKILDGIVPQSEEEEYSIILLATPVQEQLNRKNRLYEIYSALTPYASWETNFTLNESQALQSGASVGFNLGIGAGSQKGDSTSSGESTETSYKEEKYHEHLERKESGHQVNVDADAKLKAKAKNLEAVGINATTDAEVGAKYGYNKKKNKHDLIQEATKLAVATGRTLAESTSSAVNVGVHAGTNFSRISNVTATLGKNEGITQHFSNYNVKHTLDILDQQIARLEESSALGLWDFAAYVLSGNSVVANNVAYTYLALTQGEESFMTDAAVNLWRADLRANDYEHEKEQAACITTALSRLQHPEFCLNIPEGDSSKQDLWIFPTAVSAAVSLSGKELARALNFPGKSVRGLPVFETASFGRNVSSYRALQRDISLGKLYHMHIEEGCSDVCLSKNSLASHVFITGSTGAGKTNTVTELLKKIVLDDKEHNTHFLVIEPAKGEYKDVLGGYPEVSVYGTNPKLSKLLRINPFSFPEGIAVGEHIDRLVEIFNVCWPMYAAMPAIMKDAIITAYEEAGWNLDTSTNIYATPLYPSFIDVMECVKIILNRSEYSADTKGDYVGALVARLKSLTNGINGQIFTANALSDSDLFDKNVIVDMSRVGATETKSLIMGLLVMKLQEYRLSSKKPNVKTLEHVTVLEEAHNLLRRTSLEQSSESSNLMGKSVEMLTNSIAELRAFGEGFVIADQSPGLLDMAVIRNTNTKIVHRLPDQSDRELVGRSMGMNDEQIRELSRFELGVAAVYQNDWIEPVLCKVEEFPEDSKKAADEKDDNVIISRDVLKQQVIDHIMNMELCGGAGRADLKRLAELVYQSQMNIRIKRDVMEYLEADAEHQYQEMSSLLFDLLDGERAVEKVKGLKDIQDISDKLPVYLGIDKEIYSADNIRLVTEMVVCELQKRNSDYGEFFRLFVENMERPKGVL